MNSARRLGCTAFGFLLLVQLALGQATTVAVSPAIMPVNVPNQFTLNVTVSNVTNLHAASVQLAFDHNILTYNSVVMGPFLSGAFMLTPLVVPGVQYDVVTCDQAILGAATYSGSGTLLTFTFTAKAAGTTPITLQTVDLRDASNPITCSVSNGQVIVSPPLPITLVSFRATRTDENYPLLTWKTLSEIDNYGFMVQRKGPGDHEFVDLADGFVAGHGTTVEAHEYSYVDKSAGPGEWSYRLKQTDVSGPIHYSDPVQISVVASVEDPGLPSDYALEQNYPNPFNPVTTIKYTVGGNGAWGVGDGAGTRSQGLGARKTRLVVYDVLGRQVATLVEEDKAPGSHEVSFNASGLSSGIYFYELRAGGQTALKRMVVMK